MWLEAIVRDNGLGNTVYRDRKGVLVIDGVAPVEGYRYAVGTPAEEQFKDRSPGQEGGTHA